MTASFRSGAAHAFVAALEAAPSGTHGLVVDVGANDGTWTRSWRNQTRRLRMLNNISLQVVCFEPQPTFRTHLETLAAETGSEFVPAAAWKFDGELSFAVPRPGSTAAAIRKDGSLRVRSVNLADFINKLLPRKEPGAVLLPVPTPNTTLRIRTLSLMKLDTEGAEYELLPWLLTHGVLCRLDYIIVEWHLNRLDLPDRLPAIGLRLSLPSLLRAGCKQPPQLLEHDQPWEANTRVMVPGLHSLAMLHSYPTGQRVPMHTKPYLSHDRAWMAAAHRNGHSCRNGQPRCASSNTVNPMRPKESPCYWENMACNASAIEMETALGQCARRVWVSTDHGQANPCTTVDKA